MKALLSLFLGLFGTFAFSWIGLTVIPNWQIGHLDPQIDEDGTDIYPMPKSGMVERGRRVYTANGCFYCHSEQIRADYAGSDLDREREALPSPRPKWAERRSAPRDYVFDRPVLLGKTRMGPDLADIGKAAPAESENVPAPGASPTGSPTASMSPPLPSPASAATVTKQNPSPTPLPSPTSETKPSDAYSAAWHHQHLYSPRSLAPDSNMPAYRFLYDKRRISGERSADALKFTGKEAPPEGWEIVPTYDAQCLVAYLMSLDQSHPLKEVKSVAPASSPPATTSPAPVAPPK